MNETLFPLPENTPSEPTAEEPMGAPRLVTPNRAQVELRAVDLESLLAEDHEARAVWLFVESLDLEPLYAQIRAREGQVGRPATDPRIYLALWLYATAKGVGSARALARLTETHDAYRWICGGVPVNYHSLSDFRVQQVAYLDQLLTDSVAALMVQGLVKLDRVAQDGMRVRASAGAASFRRKPTLKKCRREARKQVQRLREEVEQDSAATNRRQAAARKRAVEERQRRVEEALEQMPEAESRKKRAEDRKKARTSTTDPQARVMKMSDGGFRPAYNAQLAVDTETQIVVGADVTNAGSDQGHLGRMLDQIESRYRTRPGQILADGNFVSLDQIRQAAQGGSEPYLPVMKPKDRTRDPHQPRPKDPPEVAEWRRRMGTPEAKQIYKLRAATVECVNGLMRNRGLHRFPVRGLDKARAVLLLHALAHNLMRLLSLQAAPAAA